MAKVFETLDGAVAELDAASVSWMDSLWDEGAGLLHAPDRRRHMVRETCWYALGVLQRSSSGDVARACRALHVVLDNQFDAEGAVFHGTFRRAPQEPDPPDDPVVWQHYDPNWRQFIGTVLCIVLTDYAAELTGPLADRARRAVRLAVEGEPPDRVPPTYANIALMKAWLDASAGRLLGLAGRETFGLSLAHQVAEAFFDNGAFAEYNSPTYYGVDLYALALWRGRPPHPDFARLGEAMEEALWRDVARFYHAGLKNLCGPFDRAYGMDMRRYVALVGEWIWAAVGREVAPVPDIGRTFAHPHDFCFGPCVAAGGVRVPSDVFAHLTGFTSERSLETRIADRHVTAWLSDHVMLGAQHAGGRRTPSGAYHPATVHFGLPDGGVGWIRCRSARPVDAQARPGELDVRCAGDVAFEICAPGAAVGSGGWLMPGLSLAVRTDGRLARVDGGDVVTVSYTGATAFELTVR